EVPRVRSRADYDGGARPHAVARRARASLPASPLAVPARTSGASPRVRSVRRGGRGGRACRRERGAPSGGTCSASSRAGGGEGSESDDRPEATNRQHGFVNATPSGRIYPKSGQLPDAP